MAEYKQCCYSLGKVIKQVKCQYRDKVESQFNGSDTRPMWQGLQTIMDYNRKTSPFTDTDVLLREFYGYRYPVCVGVCILWSFLSFAPHR
jgi:hypothetical protein